MGMEEVVSKIKVVAVYTKKVEVWVELGEFGTWEEAAAAVATRDPPPIPDNETLSLERIWEDQGDEDQVYHGHEVIDSCVFCGAGIVVGCGAFDCDGKKNHAESRGWVSTEHGHKVWSDQKCRDQDPDDPEREAKKEEPS